MTCKKQKIHMKGRPKAQAAAGPALPERTAQAVAEWVADYLRWEDALEMIKLLRPIISQQRQAAKERERSLRRYDPDKQLRSMMGW